MTSRVAGRIAWGVASAGIRPGDRVLEIGPGHGVALTLVLDRLTDGSVTAVDRSATMLAAAHRRNAAAVETGRLRLVQAEWPDLDGALPGSPAFDVAFAIHVPVFRRDALAAAATVHRLVVPGGTFSLVAQPLADADVEPWVDATVAAMAAAGLDVAAPLVSGHRPVRTACVTGRVPA